MAPKNATVGETRAWLEAAYGVPHTLTTHYVIITDSPDGLRITGCCDGTDETGTLLAVALRALTGEARPSPGSGSVIVAREDLRNALAALCLPVRPTAPGTALDDAITRLREAAGGAR